MTWNVEFKVKGVARVEVEAETRDEAEAVAYELVDADEFEAELKFEIYDATTDEPVDGEDSNDEAERDER